MHSGRGTGMMGHILAKILAKKKNVWPKFGPIFGLPGPPGTYFDPLYLAPIRIGPLNPNIRPNDLIFDHVSIFSSFSDPFPPLFTPYISQI